MRSRRRSRRWVAAAALLGASLVAWDQTGSFPFVRFLDRSSDAGAWYDDAAADAASSDRLASGWEGISRGRRDAGPIDAAAVPADIAAASAAPVAPTPDPAVGEVAITPAPVSFEAPPAPAPPPPAPLRSTQFDGVTPSGGTWAVMIGINDYPGTRYDLKSAINDANDVNEALGRMGVPGDHRLLIRDGQATAGTIRAATDWLTAHASSDAVAVFFYAGHVRKLDAGTEAIVGADGDVISDDELAARLDSLQARQAWIALAACYSGGFDEVVKPGRILTAAAGPNSLAYENEAFGRSYLVEYMVRRAMIESRSPTPTSVEASFAWARAALEREYPTRVPHQYDSDPAELDLRPATTRAEPQSSPTTTAPQQSPPSDDQPPSSGNGSPPPEPDDDCARLTAGFVRCDD